MRPRHLCRGNTCWTPSTPVRQRRFNEATASLPWKLPAGEGSDMPALASMRPRHLCRGNKPRMLSARAERLGFNEATASLPWKPAAEVTGGRNKRARLQ